MSKDLGITSSVVQEWITSSLSCGALIGALLGGSAADRYGRKKILLIGDAWFVLGAVLICATPTTTHGVIMIFIGRVILGFGVGIASAVGKSCLVSRGFQEAILSLLSVRTQLTTISPLQDLYTSQR